MKRITITHDPTAYPEAGPWVIATEDDGDGRQFGVIVANTVDEVRWAVDVKLKRDLSPFPLAKPGVP